jgi:hypothetical protein
MIDKSRHNENGPGEGAICISDDDDGGDDASRRRLPM